MIKKFLIPAVIVAVIVVLAIVYFTSKPATTTETPQDQTGQTTTVPKTSGTTGGTTATPPKPSGGTVQVDIKGFAFVGQTVRIAPGTTIRWKNFDTAKHTVTSDTGAFNSGIMSKDQTFSYKFAKEGTYKYKCALHPEMTGEIVVRAF